MSKPGGLANSKGLFNETASVSVCTDGRRCVGCAGGRSSDTWTGSAADLRASVVYNWTGFYIGGNLGLGWNGGSFADSIGNTLSLSPKTLFLGGAQVGFNYQFGGGFLVGAETDFDWLSNTASSSNTVVLQNPTGTPTEAPVRCRSIIGC